MRHRWLAMLLIALPAGSEAGTAPYPAGRAIAGVAGAASPRHVAVAGPARVLAAAAMPVPLPVDAVQIDSTYYDLQDFGSLGTRIVAASDGRVHVTWQDDFCHLATGGCPPDPGDPRAYEQRGMGYAFRSSGGAWTNLGKVQDPNLWSCCVTAVDHLGGHGTIAVLADGRAAIAQHMDEDCVDLRGDFYLENAAGGSSFTGYLTPQSDYLFPQVVANPNGSFVVLGEIPLHPPANPAYQETQEIRITRLPAAGTAFVCPGGWQCGPWTAVAPASLFRDGHPAFPSLANASNGRVGIAVGDLGGNVYLIESSDGTFAAGTVTTRNLTNSLDATIVATDSTSTQYRPYVHCHLAYNDTMPHVVWSELQARRVDATTIDYWDYRSRIRHWSPQRGITTVKQVAPGEADHYDDLFAAGSGPIAGFNTVSVDWPQVGFSANGQEIYVVWLRFVDAEIDPTAHAGLSGVVTGIGFGDIAASVASGTGAWSPPQNLTQTPGTDERFVSLASRNQGGRAHLVFQASATNQAGVAAIGDRNPDSGPPTENFVRRIAYLDRRLTASTIAAGPAREAARAALRIVSNPAVGRARFVLDNPASSDVRVYSADGRLISRLLPRPGGMMEWDGRDARGRPAPAGVYFARAAAVPSPAIKFLFVR
jgi:hypothetical protein